jgi:hypothetical protein
MHSQRTDQERRNAGECDRSGTRENYHANQAGQYSPPECADAAFGFSAVVTNICRPVIGGRSLPDLTSLCQRQRAVRKR